MWYKNNKIYNTISLYVIPFILFNHIIRGKEGKTGFNGVFCYSSDDSINDDKKQLIMIAYGMRIIVILISFFSFLFLYFYLKKKNILFYFKIFLLY